MVLLFSFFVSDRLHPSGGRRREDEVEERLGNSERKTRSGEDSENEQDIPEEEEEDVEVDVEECSDSENMVVRKHRKNERSPIRNGSDTSSEQGEERGRETPDSGDEKAGAAAKVKIRCNCQELLMVDCHLETKDLWDKFHDLGTEMIITKTGR